MAATTFIIYLIVLVGIALVAYSKRRNDIQDFLVSSRDHGTWMTALSASVSSESGWVTLGLVGAGYTSGVSCFWLLPGCAAGYLFNWLLLGPRIYRLSRDWSCLSIPELFDARFQQASDTRKIALRVVASLIIILFLSFYVAAQFIAGAKALEVLFGVPYIIGVVATTALVLFYTTLGGLRAVSWTDFFQAILMFGALIVVPVVAVIKIQSLVAVPPSAGEGSIFDLLAGKEGFASVGFVVGWLAIGLGYPGQPHILKRFMSADSPNVFKAGPWIALGWSQIVFAGAIVLGIAGRYLYPDAIDPELILPLAAGDLLPGIGAGLILAAVFSAICSTADSQLLEASSSVSYDLLPLLRKKKRDLSGETGHLLINRWTIFLIAVAAGVLAAISSQVIFWFVLYSWAALGAGLGTALAMSLLWRRCSATGALLALVLGPFTVIIWKTVLGWNNVLYEIVPAFAVGILVAVLGSVLFPDPDRIRIDQEG